MAALHPTIAHEGRVGPLAVSRILAHGVVGSAIGGGEGADHGTTH